MNGLEYDALPPALVSAPPSSSSLCKHQSGPGRANQQSQSQSSTNLREEEEEYEPYDVQLASRLQSLYATLESETLAVAELRRYAPLQAANLLREQLEQECVLGVDVDEVKNDEENVEGGKGGTAGGGQEKLRTGLEDLSLERRREMERNWEVGLEELRRLKGVSYFPAIAS